MCINPYHYRRVETGNVLPPVLVPRFNDFPAVPGSRLPQPGLLEWQQYPELPMPENANFLAAPRFLLLPLRCPMPVQQGRLFQVAA